MTIGAIVLAAGRATRMGGRKLELPWGEATILGTVIDALRDGGAQPVIVVLGHEAERLEPIATAHGASVCRNERYDDGMLSSVQTGLRALPELDAVLIQPGDQPGLRAATVRRMIESFAPGNGMLIPEVDGRRGHPLLLARDLWETVFELDPAVGLRQLRDRAPSRVRRIRCDDPGALEDIDTPDDYRRQRDDVTDL